MRNAVGGVAAPGDDAVPQAMHQRAVELTPELANAFRDMLKNPYTSPSDELRELRHGTQGLPPPQQLFVINIEEGAFRHNATSLRDLLDQTVASAEYQYMRDIVLLFASILCDETMGSSAHETHDPTAQLLGVAPGNQEPQQQQQQQQRQGRQQQRQQQRLGNGGGRNNIDTRGELISDGHGLVFSMGESRFPKTISCIEELRDEENRSAVTHRLWIFVYDPRFKVAEGFEQNLARNAALYSANNSPSSSYLQHFRLRTTSDYIDHVVIPYLQRGLKPCTPEAMRAKILRKIAMLSNAHHMQSIGLPLNHPDHPANPATIFSAENAFALHLDRVQYRQRDPRSYFAIEDPGDQRLINGGGPDGDEDDAYTADGGFVVPTGTNDGDDDELEAILNRVGQEEIERQADRLAGTLPASAGNEEAAAATTAVERDEQLRLEAERISKEKVIESYVRALARSTTVADFTRFPAPDLVCRVESSWFTARIIFNVPLPATLRQILRGRFAAPNAVMDNFHVDVEESGSGSSRMSKAAENDEMSGHFSDPRVPASELKSRRKAVLQRENERLPMSIRETITSEILDDLQLFRECLRAIRAKLVHHEMRTRHENAKRQAHDILTSTVAINYITQQNGPEFAAQMAGGGGGGGGAGDGSGIYILPETMTQRISTAEFAMLAAKNPLLVLRWKNVLERQKLMAIYYGDHKTREAELNKFDKRATEEVWNTLLNSPNIAPSLRTAMDWFKRLPISQQWGEHLDLCRNLSTFANMVLTMLSLYNGVFRGNTNQSAFIIATIVHYGTFEYDWGIKLNILFYGPGTSGKSYVLETIEVGACPGTFTAFTHHTDKAFVTGTSFTDQTFAMHEAPLSYMAVDKYGRTTLTDPTLKDRLARQRTGTRSFATTPDGRRITQDDLAMIMGNIMMVSNEQPPSEDSPLMQRFIAIPINEQKRPDFNVGDNSAPLKDLVSNDDNFRQIHNQQLFSFYIMILFKLVMCGAIAEPSCDASEILVKEILAEYTKMTRISTSNPRKRKQLHDFIRILCYAETVHRALFTHVAIKQYEEKVQDMVDAPADVDGDAMDVDEGDGRGPRIIETYRQKRFHPHMLLEEGLPRFFETDEQVVFGVTALYMLFDMNNRHAILKTVTKTLNNDVTTGESFKLSAASFRVYANRNATNSGNQRRTQNSSYTQRRIEFQQQPPPPPQQQQRSSLFATLEDTVVSHSNSGVTDDSVAEERDPELDAETASFLVDPRYVVFSEVNSVMAFKRIAQAMPSGERPSEIQILREFKAMTTTMYAAHQVELVRDEDSSGVTIEELPSESTVARSTQATAAAPAAAVATPSPFSLFGFSTFGSGTSRSTNGGVAVNRREPRGNERARSDQTLRGPVPQAVINAHRRDLYKWRIDESSPTKLEPVVIMYSDESVGRGGRGGHGNYNIAVLLEYVVKESHPNALTEAIARVLSNNTIVEPNGERTYLTGLPYIHTHEDGTEEVMPQFFRTLTVRRTDRDFITVHARAGTLDSEAFVRSSLRFGNENSRSSRIAREMSASEGIRFTPNVDMNQMFAMRHFSRVGLALEATDLHASFSSYTPAVESEACRRIIRSAEQAGNANLTVIENYPLDSVEDVLCLRFDRDQLRTSRYASEIFADSSDVYTRLATIEANVDPDSDKGRQLAHFIENSSRRSMRDSVREIFKFTLGTQKALNYRPAGNDVKNFEKKRKNHRKLLEELRQEQQMQAVRSRPALTETAAAAAAAATARNDSLTYELSLEGKKKSGVRPNADPVDVFDSLDQRLDERLAKAMSGGKRKLPEQTSKQSSHNESETERAKKRQRLDQQAQNTRTTTGAL